MKVDTVAEMLGAIKMIRSYEALAGFPEDKDKPRRDGDPLNNATIAIVQNEGAPASNIPQREFMRSGVRERKDQIISRAKQIPVAALDGDKEAAMRGFDILSQVARDAIKAKIGKGPFKPLSAITIRRRRSRKVAPRMGTKPLNDTGQLRNAVQGVVRRRPNS